MAKAEEHGVLVIAPAGVDGGFHDLYPAAHPWAVSCTTMDAAAFEDDEGELVRVEGVTERGNQSGKTELMQRGYAKALRPGGAYTSLEGSSVPCAQAAGWAAWLIARRPELPGAEIRRILTMSNPRPQLPNEYFALPVRTLSPQALRPAGSPDAAARGDLDLTFADLLDDADKPGEYQLRAFISNLSAVALECRLSVLIPSVKLERVRDVETIPGGETRMVDLPLGPLKTYQKSCSIQIDSPGDRNPLNNRLLMRTPPEKVLPGPSIRWVRASGLRSETREVDLTFTLANPESSAWSGTCCVCLADQEFAEPFTLAAHESRMFRRTVTLPEIPDGKSGIELSVRVKTAKEEPGDEVFTLLRWNPPDFRTQYADVFDRKEVILDAPASTALGRTVIPLVIFARKL